MKKTTLILSTICLLSLTQTSCKKKGCTDENATNYDSNAKKDDGSCVLPSIETPQTSNDNFENPDIQTYIINDTIDFTTSGNTVVSSAKIGYQGITNDLNSAHYVIESHDSTGTSFGSYNHKNLRFKTVNGAVKLVNNYSDFELKRFDLEDEINIDSPGLENTTSSPWQSTSILSEQYSTLFNTNSTQYIGLKFNENNNSYYGWLKIKTLNNEYSCIIESYSVSTEPNQPIKIIE